MNVHFRISAMVVVLICLARTYVHAHLEPVVIQQYQMVVQNYIQVILANYLLSISNEFMLKSLMQNNIARIWYT